MPRSVLNSPCSKFLAGERILLQPCCAHLSRSFLLAAARGGECLGFLLRMLSLYLISCAATSPRRFPRGQGFKGNIEFFTHLYFGVSHLPVVAHAAFSIYAVFSSPLPPPTIPLSPHTVHPACLFTCSLRLLITTARTYQPATTIH